MSKIQVLDQITIDKIAAGEVIERPASVVKELVENAIDARASAVTVEIQEGGIAMIRITDNGIGIAKEDIPHIFDRFYKTDRSRGRDKSGAGLGLSFVKNILNLHSQKITVSSVGAEGGKMKTTFSFTLERA